MQAATGARQWQLYAIPGLQPAPGREARWVTLGCAGMVNTRANELRGFLIHALFPLAQDSYAFNKGCSKLLGKLSPHLGLWDEGC